MTSPPCWSTSSKSHPARSTATLTATRARRSERRATDPAPHGRVAPAHCGRKSRGPVIAVGRRRDLLTPGNAPITKGDFARGFQEVSAKARIEATQEVKEIRVSGDIATAWSHLTVVLTPKEGGTTSEASGYVLTAFHRSPSGKWLLARDANLVAGAGNPGPVCAGLELDDDRDCPPAAAHPPLQGPALPLAA